MVRHTIKIGTSFEAAMAARLVQKAGEFASHVSIVVDEKTANAKSIMGILSLGFHGSDKITIITSGEDEEYAAAEMLKFFGAADA